jgi:hypothetical protein
VRQYTSNHEGEELMGMDLSTKGGVEWEPGAYEGYLERMEKRFKKFTTQNEDGSEKTEDRSFVIWHLGLSEEGFENVTLTAVSSAPPWGPKAKPRGWASAILRRPIGDDEHFNEDDLRHKPVMINVVLKTNDRGTFAEVESLSPVRTKKGGKKAEEPKERELTEQDVEDMNKSIGSDDDQQKAS